MRAFLLLPFFVLMLSTGVCAQSGGYPFQVKKTGGGERAILFIPGFGCSGDEWLSAEKLFSDSYTCYTLTMAGFAGVPPADSISFAFWETRIADFIREKKLDKPVIIGHSMGGGLAMALAADYPALVGRLVVVDALPCLAAMMNPAFRANPSNDCGPVVARMKAMSDTAFTQMQRATIPRLLADTVHLNLVLGWSLASDRRTFGTMYCDFTNTDLREKIARVQCPALVLLEPYFTNFKPAIETQFSAMKTAELRYATKGLHFIMYDDPDWYQAQLKQFIHA